MPASARGTSSSSRRSSRRPRPSSLSRRATPEHLIFISLAIGAAGAAAAAFYRTLAPFARQDPEMLGEPLSSRARAALEREKALVLRSLKELEFDQAMGKLSAARLRGDERPAARPRAAPHQATRRRRLRLPRDHRARAAGADGRDGSGRRAVADGRPPVGESTEPAQDDAPSSEAAAGTCRGVRHRQRRRRRVLQALRHARLLTRPAMRATAISLLCVLVLLVRRRPRAPRSMPDLSQMSGVPLPVGDVADRHRHRAGDPRLAGQRHPGSERRARGRRRDAHGEHQRAGRAEFTELVVGTSVKAPNGR